MAPRLCDVVEVGSIVVTVGIFFLIFFYCGKWGAKCNVLMKPDSGVVPHFVTREIVFKNKDDPLQLLIIDQLFSLSLISFMNSVWGTVFH